MLGLLQVKVKPIVNEEEKPDARFGAADSTSYGIEMAVQDLNDGTYKVEYTRTKMCVSLC